jgi:hypothetical protein
MQRLKLLAGALALLALTGEATAQLKPKDAPVSKVTPLGSWQFESQQLSNQCKMSGFMQVFRPKAGAPAKTKYSCRLTAYQTCTGGAIKKIRTAQSCDVSEKDGKLMFESRLDKIESVEPAEIMAMVKAGYAPDNFLVELNKAGSEMSGLFISISQAPVKFLRLEELTS